jgi:hypothetical protein
MNTRRATAARMRTMVCRSMSASLSGCVSGAGSSCSLVEVGAEAGDDAWSDVLA